MGSFCVLTRFQSHADAPAVPVEPGANDAIFSSYAFGTAGVEACRAAKSRTA